METDTEGDIDDEAPSPRDHINNDPVFRAQEECCTVIIGGDETAPDTNVGNPDMDGRPSTSGDDPTSKVNNKNKEHRRWRKKSQSMKESYRPNGYLSHIFLMLNWSTIKFVLYSKRKNWKYFDRLLFFLLN